jgi:hypothetical protein
VAVAAVMAVVAVVAVVAVAAVRALLPTEVTSRYTHKLDLETAK